MGGKRKHQVSEQKSNSHPKGKGKSYAKGQSDNEDGEGSLEKKSVVYVIALVAIGECFRWFGACGLRRIVTVDVASPLAVAPLLG